MAVKKNQLRVSAQDQDFSSILISMWKMPKEVFPIVRYDSYSLFKKRKQFPAQSHSGPDFLTKVVMGDEGPVILKSSRQTGLLPGATFCWGGTNTPRWDL